MLKKEIDVSVLSLHTHWITADAIKERMFLDIEDSGGQVPKEFEELGQHFSRIQTMVVFYALLYVVVEGYRELKLKDEAIDTLLAKNQHEDQLRRFRNALFHFQKYPFDKRLIEFLDAKDSEQWVKNLHAAFAKFFVSVLPIAESLERFKKAGGVQKGMGELAQ